MPDKTQSDSDSELTGEVVPAGAARPSAETQGADSLTEFLTQDMAEMQERQSDPMQRIIQQVLDADSVDAVLTPVEVMQARDIVGVPFILQQFDLNQSEFDAGSPFYASIVAIMPPGDDVRVVNCGHKKVLAQLVKLRQFDALPCPVKFIERGRSGQGTPMLELSKWAESDGPPPF
jgi:hypothetical protein